jgi:arylsulfatase A-like enzyme
MTSMPGAASSPSRRPDIVVIYTDQMRADVLGCVNPIVHTPNLDRLARDGVRFDSCFVQSPVCMPSRVSLLTGRTPSDLHITEMGVPVPDDVITLPDILGRYGYRSANIGKLHFLPHANRDHRLAHPRYGFDVLEISDEPGPYPDAYRAWLSARAPGFADTVDWPLPPAAAAWREQMRPRRPWQPQHQAAPPPAGRDDFVDPVAFPGADDLTHPAFVADRARAFIRSTPAEQPSFCVASFFSPHAPFVVPQRFLDLYDRDALPLPQYPPEVDRRREDAGPSDDRLRAVRHGYFAAISEVDHHVGAILDELAASGRAEQAVVVLISDHGEWLGDHLRFGKGYPGCDPVSRVPFVVRWPAGIASPGTVVPDLVEALDIAPTLLSAAGIQVPPSMQGRDLAPLLGGGSVAELPGALTEASGWKTLRTPTHRYVIHDDGSERLWQLADDPGEYRDISADAQATGALAECRFRLLSRLLSLERSIPPTWPY